MCLLPSSPVKRISVRLHVQGKTGLLPTALTRVLCWRLQVQHPAEAAAALLRHWGAGDSPPCRSHHPYTAPAWQTCAAAQADTLGSSGAGSFLTCSWAHLDDCVSAIDV